MPLTSYSLLSFSTNFLHVWLLRVEKNHVWMVSNESSSKLSRIFLRHLWDLVRIFFHPCSSWCELCLKSLTRLPDRCKLHSREISLCLNVSQIILSYKSFDLLLRSGWRVTEHCHYLDRKKASICCGSAEILSHPQPTKDLSECDLRSCSVARVNGTIDHDCLKNSASDQEMKRAFHTELRVENWPWNQLIETQLDQQTLRLDQRSA